MSNQWFRMYHDFSTNPKVQSLPEALQRRYVMLLCLQCKGELDRITGRNGNSNDSNAGVTARNGSVTARVIATALRVTEEEIMETKKVLIEFGLIDENWAIHNWEKRQYISDLKDPTNAARQQRYRERKRNASNGNSNGESNGDVTHQNTDYRIQNNKDNRVPDRSETINCPHQEIINLYHKNCPALTRIKILTEKRKKQIQSRWRQSTKHQSLEFWEKFFSHVARSPFLCGENERQWKADLEWLTNQSNFAKVIEGKYHQEQVH